MACLRCLDWLFVCGVRGASEDHNFHAEMMEEGGVQLDLGEQASGAQHGHR